MGEMRRANTPCRQIAARYVKYTLLEAVLDKYNSFIREHERKRLLWMSRCGREDNIKVDIATLHCKGVKGLSWFTIVPV
jgi:hypothetical protein